MEMQEFSLDKPPVELCGTLLLPPAGHSDSLHTWVETVGRRVDFVLLLPVWLQNTRRISFAVKSDFVPNLINKVCMYVCMWPVWAYLEGM